MDKTELYRRFEKETGLEYFEYATELGELIPITYANWLEEQLRLCGVGVTLPSKKAVMTFAIDYTKKEMPEFNEQDKICFRAGVLKCHRWLDEGKIK